MDPYQIATVAVTLLFGTQGVASFIKARRSKRTGALPADEQDARQAAALPDWAGFNAYWKKEIRDLQNRFDDLERQRNEDAEHIDALEEHIWLQKPPPPPQRRKRP